MPVERRYHAGDSIEDHCRSCHEDRTHKVIVVDAQGRPLRVLCGICGSQHNFRGGPRMTSPSATPRPRVIAPEPTPPTVRAYRAPEPSATTTAPRPTVEREKPEPSMTTTGSPSDLEQLLRRVIREEAGLTPARPAEKWRGGEIVLRPGRPGVQEKTWPIDAFFHKIVMMRNRLRTLEQQVNASDLPADQKLKLQSYVTGCYGSLTSFNVLFADEEDRFVGSGQD